MGSIAAAIAAGQAYRQQYPNAAPVPEPTPQNLVQPVVSPLPPNGATGLPNRGVFPANTVLASDRSNNTQEFRTSNMRSPTFPYPPPIQPTKTTVETTVSESSGGSTLTIEVNNLKTPSQALLNFLNTPGVVWSVGPNGQIYATVTVTSDGLIHGTTPWEIDPSYYSFRDDFSYNGAGNTATYIGETSWLEESISAADLTYVLLGGSAYHPGILQMYLAVTTRNVGSALIRYPFSSGSSASASWAMPLLDYAGWNYSAVFMWGRADTAEVLTSTPFSMTQLSWYLGFANNNQSTLPCRPSMFLGIRFDTDPGYNGTVTAIANASAGNTVYTVTGGSTTSGYYVGNMITIAGCSGGTNNNGVFLCVAYTSGSLTLKNPNGVVETGQSGTFTQPSIGDSTFMFEYVANPFGTATEGQRNNTQGQTYNTGVTPTEGEWYRLDMSCTVSGVVTLTLSGGGSKLATTTFTTTKVTWGTITAGSGNIAVGDGYASFTPANTFNGTNTVDCPFGIGSLATTGGTVPAGLPSVLTVGGFNNGLASFQIPQGAASYSGGSFGFTLTGYPGLYPYHSFCNDSENSAPNFGRAVNLDFIGFVENPGLAGASPNSGYSRYFSGT